MPDITPRDEDDAIDWNRALFVASLVDSGATEPAHDGALRIAHACIQSRGATTSHHSAARVLLERLGNQRAIDLAVKKDLLNESELGGVSLPLEMDILRQSVRLSVPLNNGGMAKVNEFQLQFWNAAEKNDWVSVSAPTSVGKSYIVKLWIQRSIQQSEFTAVYVVPTRALVEEVSRDLAEQLGGECDVFTLPWDSRIGGSSKRVFVFTQERLHVLQQNLRDVTIDLIFVDEAQKVGDGTRGLLLQRVIDEALLRNPGVKLIFASPLSANPELLLQGSPAISATAITSESVTVNQNLIHANQIYRQPMRWNADLLIDGRKEHLGTFSLPARPSPVSKRLALVAVALGAKHSGNVVYANGAHHAETVAGQIVDLLPSDSETSEDEDIAALRQLIEKTIHSKYLLSTFLRKRVAFHYGNMPLLVREEIERLFRIGKIHYLVCTSTLLEGVNLPCRNLFVRGPKKGNSSPMSPGDFWNLAGRAGRWGVEFQGNIVCVDTEVESVWESVPTRRVRQPITRASDVTLADKDLIRFIEMRAPLADARKNKNLEAFVSTLAVRYREGVELSTISWLQGLDSRIDAISDSLSTALNGVTVSARLCARHAGITPFAIQRLADYFRQHEDKESLLLSPPESFDAAQSYVSVISRIDRYLGGGFSSHPGRQYQLAILLVKWMRGMPLSLLIEDRIKYLRKTTTSPNLPKAIRDVMGDVEQLARFEAPLYFACYIETLREVFPDLSASERGANAFPDIAMMLELGVSRTTELSMMSLGLSRTSAVELSEHVMRDELSPEECIAWLQGVDLDGIGLPDLVVREIRDSISRFFG
ncbi:DEAD/DEAH box helicase [Rhodococcus sp. ACT016]|uniref:DEAD/DEAH box helicase n=1 Tax=Rhodococcus sp. ACT016 TaxID=3134808 RepID=UPI003D2ACAF9